jgi:hypothetical protein
MDDRTNSNPKLLRRTAWICAGISAFLVVVTLLAVVLETHRALSGRSADATVARYESRSGSSDPPKPLIQFRTESGEIVETRYPSSINFDRPPIGEHVAVVYDPANPRRVVAKEFSFRVRTYALLLGFAAFWMIPAITSFRRLRQLRAVAHGTEVRRS